METQAGISVVIPTYRDDAAQIIISDAELRPVSQNILHHAAPHKPLYLNAPKGRGAQIAKAIKACTHPYIWILHADSLPHEDSVPAIQHLLSSRQTALGCFPITFSQDSIWLKLFSFVSRFDSCFTTFGDQGYVFRRSDFEALELDLNAYPLLEDVALRRALITRGVVRKSHLKITTSARRFEKLGCLRTQFYNFGIIIRHALGENPRKLYERYYGVPIQTAPKPLPSSTARRA